MNISHLIRDFVEKTIVNIIIICLENFISNLIRIYLVSISSIQMLPFS
jgi:hypothetical protein